MRILFIFLTSLLIGCTNPTTEGGFEPRRLAQSDTQLVLEQVRAEIDRELDQLIEKLYKRNPKFLRASGQTLEQRQAQLRRAMFYQELNEKRGVDAIRQAFRSDFSGDRVFSYVYGLASMIDDSYDRKRAFYLLDRPSGKSIFNSARNIETALYLLRSQRDDRDELYLLADGYQGKVLNASFAMLHGRLAAKQDLVADALGDNEQRTLNMVARSIASTVFLPIGF